MKIPEDRKPYEVIINGVKKTYEGGATVADDAAVKEIIDNGDLFPPEAPAADTPFPIPEQSGGTEVVANPEMEGDEDSLTGIQIGDTKYAVGGGGGVLIVNSTVSGDVITLDTTADEMFVACQEGKNVVVLTNISQIDAALPVQAAVNDGMGGSYGFMCQNPFASSLLVFQAANADAYPQSTDDT